VVDGDESVVLGRSFGLVSDEDGLLEIPIGGK